MSGGLLSGRSRIAGIMGHPVGHSLSPRLHGHWLRRHRIDGAYIPMPVAPTDLEPALRALPKLGLRGCNLTIPHKEAALRIVDRASERATRIGAVNTVVVEADGTLSGHNTDGYGFLESLHEVAAGGSPTRSLAVVIGAGGAARAIVVALQDAGAPLIRVLNRTRDRADVLAEELHHRIEVADWSERGRAVEGAALLVNTTSLGMVGQPSLDLPLDRLPESALVADAVYIPLETPLLAAARARGNRCIDGLGMLLHQGRPGFEAWFGVRPEVDDDLRAVMLEALGR
ncbi:MAG TPA: shikimate dehydrogenase [Geminicoccaceae bacterium]